MSKADRSWGQPESANIAKTEPDDRAQRPRETLPSSDTDIHSDQITVGNVDNSVVAVGRGARALVNNIDTYIQHYSERALTEVEEAEQARRLEQKQLAQAVRSYIQRLDRQASEAHNSSSDGQPYKYVHAYELPDADRFAGRVELTEKLLEKVVCADSRCRLVILDGQAKIGKTSLLRAGIVPALVSSEHLPLYIQVPPSSTKSITTIIKESLLPDLRATPLLAQMPLRAFIRQVTDLLPNRKRLFVILDRFEAVLTLTDEVHAAFREELAACLFDDDPREHWLISIDAAYTSDLNQLFQPTISYPLANTLKVPPLARKEAQEAIVEPAKRYGLQYREGLVDMMVSDLGGNDIDPSYLQVLCFALVEALPPGEKLLSVDIYQKQGGADGVLGAFLDRTMNHLPVASREAGWQILDALLGAHDGKTTGEELVSSLRLEGLRESETRRALKLLIDNGLLRQRGEEYQLATEHFEARIRAWGREWAAKRAVAEHIRTEFRRQAWHIVGSALRGLIGGALGFGLAYWIAFAGQGLDYIWQLTLFRLLPGALAGLIVILAADVALVSYSGKKKRWLPWLWGGGGGALGFGLALPYHFFFFLPPGLPLWRLLRSLAPVALEGALWGSVTGLGIVWVMRGERDLKRIVPKLVGVLAIASCVLWLADNNGLVSDAFVMPDPAALIFLAGAVMPLCVISAALLPGWVRKQETEDEDRA